MKTTKVDWKPSSELFAKSKIDGKVILMHAKRAALVCKDEKTAELFLCGSGYPPVEFDLYEATDLLAGRTSQYLYKIV